MQILGDKLLKLAYFYYKIAQSTQLPLPFDPKDLAPTKNNKQQEYEEFIKNLPATTVKDILIGINHFYDEPYFNFDEVAQPLMRALFKHSQRLSIIKAVVYYDTDLHTSGKIMPYVFKYFIDHFLDQMNWRDYLDFIEKDDDLPENYLRRAQAAAIKKIMEWGTSGDYNDWLNSKDYLENLIKSSTKFNQDLLWRVAKHIGPEFFGQLASRLNTHDKETKNILLPERVENIRQKSIYTIYDVAELLNHKRFKHAMMSNKFFQDILNKADDKAKEYLRQFLYTDGASSYFILDEEMRPMNSKYQRKPLPHQLQILRNWQKIKPLQDIWAPIFNEFKIVPMEE